MQRGCQCSPFNSESFVPDVGSVLRSQFGKFRSDLGARGLRDIACS